MNNKHIIKKAHIMPELPEIETILRGIKPYLVGNTILHSIVRNSKLRWQVATEIFHIRNKLIINIERRARFLLIQLEHGWIIIHLGMSGSIRILTKQELAKKHDHIDLILNTNKILRYTDPRRFGFWLWTNNLDNYLMLANLGPEPLSSKFNTDYLFRLTKNKKSIIKPWLMNNKIIAGIGNIYANEALFAAKILPTRVISSLTRDEVDNLTVQIKRIVQDAIKHKGTTLKNFVQSNGTPGYFAQQLFVYGRKNKICLKCNNFIKLITLKQRSSYFCDYCQN